MKVGTASKPLETKATPLLRELLYHQIPREGLIHPLRGICVLGLLSPESKQNVVKRRLTFLAT